MATTAILLDDRFRWGVGAGENLNEHVVGVGRPLSRLRQEIAKEAVAVIRRLWNEESVTHRGRYHAVEDARIGSSASGIKSS